MAFYYACGTINTGVYMDNKYAGLKILSVVAVGVLTIVLASFQAGDTGPYPGKEAGSFSGDIGAEVPADRQGTADGGVAGSAAGRELSVKAADELDRWNPPIYSLLRTKSFAILGFELLKDGTYPIIHTAIPFGLTAENEGRMTDILGKIADLNSWRDFEMIDATADARIKVVCDRQYGMVDEVIINGDRNFFVRLAQKNAAENYSYKAPIDFKQEGKLLGLLQAAGWKRKGLERELGESDSFFDGYEIYFEKGVSVQYSADRVYNIVLNGSYEGAVLHRIGFEAGYGRVVEMLGTPQFEDGTRELYGYKSSNYYIFFTGKDKLKEISIYFRDTAYARDTLARLLGRYGSGQDQIDLYSFIDDLQKEWPDYDLYYNQRGGLGISYDSIGVEVNNWYEDRGGPFITVYSNFEGALDSSLELPGKADGLKNYSNDLLLLRLDADSVFEAEKGRLGRSAYLNGRRQEEGAVSPDGRLKVLKNNEGTYDTAGLYILSTDRSGPDRSSGLITGILFMMYR